MSVMCAWMLDQIKTLPPAVSLPSPDRSGAVPIAMATSGQRPSRLMREGPTLAELGQVLWAVSGPVRLITTRVATAQALFRYVPGTHMLIVESARDVRPTLLGDCPDLRSYDAPAVLLLSARIPGDGVDDRERCLTWLAAGRAAEKLVIQASGVGLSAVLITRFPADVAARACRLLRSETPLLLAPIGYPVPDA